MKNNLFIAKKIYNSYTKSQGEVRTVKSLAIFMTIKRQ